MLRRLFYSLFALAALALFAPKQEAQAQLSIEIYSNQPQSHYGLRHHERPRNYYAPQYRRAYAPHYRPGYHQYFRPAPVLPIFNGPLNFGAQPVQNCQIQQQWVNTRHGQKIRNVRVCY